MKRNIIFFQIAQILSKYWISFLKILKYKNKFKLVKKNKIINLNIQGFSLHFLILDQKIKN